MKPIKVGDLVSVVVCETYSFNSIPDSKIEPRVIPDVEVISVGQKQIKLKGKFRNTICKKDDFGKVSDAYFYGSKKIVTFNEDGYVDDAKKRLSNEIERSRLSLLVNLIEKSEQLESIK